MMPTTNKRSKTSNDDSSDINATQKRLLVPTFTNKKDTEELDLSSMTEEELKLLQKKDPFLYYSIPAVREAALTLKEVDYSKVLQSTRNVTRNSRVSFENHVDFLLDELFGSDESDGFDDSGLLESLISLYSSSTSRLNESKL